jgi:YD repeat-containing protein
LPRTPTANFFYDESAASVGNWTSPTLKYPKGRLTHTTTTSGSTLLTATVQDYDQMGRTKHYWQCTPLNCGTSSIWAALYNYDAAGDVTSWNHPAGFTITQTFNGARDIEQVTSSLSDSTHPGTLALGTCLPYSTSICNTA